MLSDEILRVYELHRFHYRTFDEAELLPGIGLGLQLWHGVFEDPDNSWLRWIDAEGKLIATGGERAEHAELRADKLAEQLRRLGVKPEV